MKHSNFLICPGEACPLRLTCDRFHWWLDSEDDDTYSEIEPDYKDGKCTHYIQREFYGQ